jgi:alkylhydroperoxidase/carboxymuconolactone decarboxylase family protein YurZ
MSGAEVVALVSSLISLAKKFPELLSAVEGVFQAHKAGKPLDASLRHLEAVAAARALGITEEV